MSWSRGRRPWALTGAKGREPHIVASLRLNPDEALEQLNEELLETYQQIAENEVDYEEFQLEDAEYIMVAYGTSSRVCRSAIRELRKEGIKVGMFRPITLWPFPTEQLKKAAGNAKKILTVEMSAGQMVEDVKLAINGEVEVDFYGRMAGMLPDIEEIKERIKSYGK